MKFQGCDNPTRVHGEGAFKILAKTLSEIFLLTKSNVHHAVKILLCIKLVFHYMKRQAAVEPCIPYSKNFVVKFISYNLLYDGNSP